MVVYSLLESSTFLYLMARIAKVVEIVGSSAKKTIRGITGVEVGDMTAKVDPNSGNITEYHTAIKIAFGVER
jgi:hypothetical protein